MPLREFLRVRVPTGGPMAELVVDAGRFSNELSPRTMRIMPAAFLERVATLNATRSANSTGELSPSLKIEMVGGALEAAAAAAAAAEEEDEAEC